jgi:uncharacterized membrane protein
VTFYEILKTVHVLAIATWFGSGVAITVIGMRALKESAAAFSPFAVHASWWAGRAHPAAGVVLLLTGFGMIGDADISIGEPWILIALIGLIVAMGIGGALIGPSSTKMTESIKSAGGTLPAEGRPHAERLLLWSRVESVILLVIVADMVIKPG